jgi:hypothetical protein
MEPEDSSQRSQESTTRFTLTRSIQSTPSIDFFKTHYNIILPPTPRFNMVTIE